MSMLLRRLLQTIRIKNAPVLVDDDALVVGQGRDQPQALVDAHDENGRRQARR